MEKDIQLKQIAIYHSNDIHSRLENSAKIATIINNGRKQYGEENVIAVDIGDHMDRARMETEGTDGYIHRELLNETRYDVITLGNNEGLTFTAEQLNAVYSGNNSFQVVCSNIHSTEQEDPNWLLPHLIMEINGIKIGFVAATADFTDFYEQMGWQTEEPLQAINTQVANIRDHVDIIVLLSHLGIKIDEMIAEKCCNIDVIMGAHTHHLLDPPVHINNTLVCAAGKFGSHVGKVTIQLDTVSNELTVFGECIATAAYEEQTSITNIISEYGLQAKEVLKRPITILQAPLPTSIERESPLSNLLAMGLRKWCDAEIGLVNSGQLLAGLAVGEVTAGEIHGICPSPINPCRMTLLGKDIKEALEQSILDEFIQLPIRGYGFRGERLGNLAVDGLEIQVKRSNPPMDKIISIKVNGIPLQLDQYYSVGTIDMFTFNVGYKSLANYKEVTYCLPEFIRYIVEVELMNLNNIDQSHYHRWSFS
ncbi:bifunctional metallophosphatase/5'-nucleotidase [Paenibacillus endoradicis]|uniref:bifunctional metallophosphatase/5'-nucleotidase n=1 Tax=Paenibacillus endoradicis TaxID=2972487 RepID=UPI0021593BCA|nr:bifunctional UDP-sugar hydrolase/5'-nucleotidase [Paenibacillus endoradicis]MCR8659016.1 bifunctional metallophosphatase/5'-nucleotidase [Paenibacillus endoradicis]